MKNTSSNWNTRKESTTNSLNRKICNWGLSFNTTQQPYEQWPLTFSIKTSDLQQTTSLSQGDKVLFQPLLLMYAVSACHCSGHIKHRTTIWKLFVSYTEFIKWGTCLWCITQMGNLYLNWANDKISNVWDVNTVSVHVVACDNVSPLIHVIELLFLGHFMFWTNGSSYHFSLPFQGADKTQLLNNESEILQSHRLVAP